MLFDSTIHHGMFCHATGENKHGKISQPKRVYID